MILGLIDEAVANGARLKPAAALLGLSYRTVIRWRDQDDGDRRRGPNRAPANKLSEQERQQVVEVANSAPFRDMSPSQIVPRLADAKIYLASESSFYRILKEQKMLAHRQGSKPAVSKRPKEHVATGPCQVWSWDITYLQSQIRGVFFYLYMFMDVWSRKIVAAEVFTQESMENSSWMFARTCMDLGLNPEGLVLHADNGSPMKGATMAATMQKLGVIPSFSRPSVSNDNPYSESLFRTMKYRPEYPSKPFESVEQAQVWVDAFVSWYNTEHLHSAVRFVTPDDRHCGREEQILANRQKVYEQARNSNPERWSGQIRNWHPVRLVRLNPETAYGTSQMPSLKQAA